MLEEVCSTPTTNQPCFLCFKSQDNSFCDIKTSESERSIKSKQKPQKMLSHHKICSDARHKSSEQILVLLVYNHVVGRRIHTNKHMIIVLPSPCILQSQSSRLP
jgi:hypothetical protein